MAPIKAWGNKPMKFMYVMILVGNGELTLPSPSRSYPAKRKRRENKRTTNIFFHDYKGPRCLGSYPPFHLPGELRLSDLRPARADGQPEDAFLGAFLICWNFCWGSTGLGRYPIFVRR